jgi:hypothetical protein
MMHHPSKTDLHWGQIVRGDDGRYEFQGAEIGVVEVVFLIYFAYFCCGGEGAYFRFWIWSGFVFAGEETTC